jgi:hypothetical protein
MMREPERRVRWLTSEPIDAPLTAAKQVRDRARHPAPLITLALHAGMPLGNMSYLKRSRVDLDRDLIYREGMNLDSEVGSLGCVPHLVRQGAARLRKGSTKTCCNDAGGRGAPGGLSDHHPAGEASDDRDRQPHQIRACSMSGQLPDPE